MVSGYAPIFRKGSGNNTVVLSIFHLFLVNRRLTWAHEHAIKQQQLHFINNIATLFGKPVFKDSKFCFLAKAMVFYLVQFAGFWNH